MSPGIKHPTPASRAQRPRNPALTDHLRSIVTEGLRFQRYGYPAEAADCYRRALELDSRWFDALQLLGVLRFRSGEVESGIDLMQRALTLEPDHSPTLNNLGNALRAVGRWHEAITAYRSALKVAGSHPMILRNLGSALLETGQLDEAAKRLTQARELQGGDAELHCWLGHLGRALNRPADAVEAYANAVNLDASLAQAHRGLGSALRDIGRPEDALQSFETALKLDPGLLAARVFRSNLALSQAVWQHWDADRAAIEAAKPTRSSAVDPFSMFYLYDSHALLRRYAEAFSAQTLAQAPQISAAPQTRAAPQTPAAPRPQASGSGRIRVAYVSGDIREHPVAQLTAGIFERHDRSRFDIRLYALGEEDPSALRAKIAAGCEQFVPLTAASDLELATRLRADQNDIVVDLMGYTQRGQPRALATRPAPVMVSWLGYPGTLGGTFMDYLLADEFIVPAGAEDGYSEQIVRLPHTYQPNNCERPVHEPLPRDAYGLPDDALVLCSFNHAQKINPPLFDVWMNILLTAPDAVLWLSVRAETAKANLRREAVARGVDSGRLIFAVSVPSNADHLARYHAADLALDTFPYGSHTTASDALWAGCPLVALVGESLASRVSGSVVRAVGLPELVTTSFESYKELVLTLAADRNRLRALRKQLAVNRHACPLFDTARFVRSLETAYQLMHERACNGLPPTHLSIGQGTT